MENTTSPIKRKPTLEMSFFDAIKAVSFGKKVRRNEWVDEKEHGILKDSFLMIFRNENYHTWIVSEGDLLASDWVIAK